jgi:hypothetical protein
LDQVHGLPFVRAIRSRRRSDRGTGGRNQHHQRQQPRLWAVDKDRTLQIVMRKGDKLDVNGTKKTITALKIF